MVYLSKQKLIKCLLKSKCVIKRSIANMANDSEQQHKEITDFHCQQNKRPIHGFRDPVPIRKMHGCC